MQKDDAVRLRHMLDAAQEAAFFAQNKTGGPSTLIDNWCCLSLNPLKS
jgi:uncharacterized protein with HEPN domain